MGGSGRKVKLIDSVLSGLVDSKVPLDEVRWARRAGDEMVIIPVTG